MLIQEKKGNIHTHSPGNKKLDWVLLEWYETRKRVLRKKTQDGKDIALKFMDENPALTQGDILFEDEQLVIAVEIVACNCIVLQPKNMFEMAAICYEIGNKHLPLFFENDKLLVPFENPLYKLLSSQGYPVILEKRKLLHPLSTTVSPHGNSGSDSLFTKIMKLTTTPG